MSMNIIYGKLYFFCGGPLIPANVDVMNDMASCLLTMIWIHPILIKQDDMVSDDDMLIGMMIIF